MGHFQQKKHPDKGVFLHDIAFRYLSVSQVRWTLARKFTLLLVVAAVIVFMFRLPQTHWRSPTKYRSYKDSANFFGNRFFFSICLHYIWLSETLVLPLFFSEYLKLFFLFCAICSKWEQNHPLKRAKSDVFFTRYSPIAFALDDVGQNLVTFLSVKMLFFTKF